MALKIENEAVGDGAAAILRCNGDLDAHTFETLDDAIAELIDAEQAKIIVDLSGVPYMSSAGIGVLVGGRTEAEGGEGDLILLKPTESVMDVLQSMGFDNVFTIVASEAEALSALGIAGGAPAEKEQEAGRSPGRRKGFD